VLSSSVSGAQVVQFRLDARDAQGADSPRQRKVLWCVGASLAGSQRPFFRIGVPS
jgi:hypothetical protein